MERTFIRTSWQQQKHYSINHKDTVSHGLDGDTM